MNLIKFDINLRT